MREYENWSTQKLIKEYSRLHQDARHWESIALQIVHSEGNMASESYKEAENRSIQAFISSEKMAIELRRYRGLLDFGRSKTR